MYPKHLLMVRPDHFRVDYAINPHMRDKDGHLHRVDSPRALAQWEQLQMLYREIGLHVHVLDGNNKFPDMVFAANQTLPFLRDGKPALLLSNMISAERKGEVPFFASWAKAHDLPIFYLDGVTCEGAGDLIWNFESGEIFAGYGFRTQKAALPQVESLIGRPVRPLELIDNRFYHLDTCFFVINKNTAAFLPSSMTRESQGTLEKHFSDLIILDAREAETNFAGNAFCPDGKNVFLQRGSSRLVAELKKRSLSVHEVETSEFIKSGGSVFCLKQQLWLS